MEERGDFPMQLLCCTCSVLTQNTVFILTLMFLYTVAHSMLEHVTLSVLHPNSSLRIQKQHAAAQQHLRKPFTLQEGTLRAAVIPLFFFLFFLWMSSFSLHFHFSMTEEKI